MNVFVKNLRQRIDRDDPIYPGLRRLKLQGVDLKRVPFEVFHLTELEVLTMSPERQPGLFYRLVSVPALIGNLVNLKVLHLDTNLLTYLPREIGNLKSLHDISLSNNMLINLPEEFRCLQNLKNLHLANNQFTSIPDPIFDLGQLIFLDLSSNRLETIPGKRIKRLSRLEALFLNSNRLQKLPHEIGDLKQLRIFWLGNNLIFNLPDSIKNLPNLNWSMVNCPSATLDGNPLRYPPIDVCKTGSVAMQNYKPIVNE